MKKFADLKIRTKMFVGFGTIIVLLILLTVYSLGQITNIRGYFNYAIRHPIHGEVRILEFRGAVREFRRIAATIPSFAHTGDTAQIDNYNRLAIAAYNAGLEALDRFDEGMAVDPRVPQDVINAVLSDTAEMRRLFTEYLNTVYTPLVAAARLGNVEEADAYLMLGAPIVGALAESVDELLGLANAVAADSVRSAEQVADGTFRLLIIFGILIILVAIAFALFVSYATSSPIQKLRNIVFDVSKGHMDVNIDRSNISKDEIGMLTGDIYSLVDVVKNIVGDLSKMEHEFNAVGDFEYRIDTDKYQNSFREMIEKVHAIIDDQMKDIVGVLGIIGQIGDGDFDITVSDMPGKKAVMPQMLRTVIDTLNGISAEVNAMIDAVASEGNLDFRIDTEKYKGDWRKIMVGLNDIAKAVDTPLRVLDMAMEEMRNGNFDLDGIDRGIRATGIDPTPDGYEGIFKTIMIDFDATIINTASYINELEEILAKMAAGDLRNRIERNYVGSFDSIKNSVNNINDTLHKTMSEISAASGQMLSGASQISTSATTLANGAQEQASSVQELNATIDVISQQTKQNADSAAAANELSGKSTTNAREGNDAMKQMVDAMLQIKESSNSISTIVKTIQDIAFQTNLLALNASVEAARAGEHGKSFSVVADEVRTLAARSQTAATETTALIQDSIGRVEAGSSIAETTAGSLEAIVEGAGQVLEIIGGISTASRQQVEAIGQVSEGLSQISNVVQRNSAVSQESAASSQELSSQAEVLQQMVAFFKL